MPTYDEKLLADAPEVTKADLQDGYNSELLHEPTVKRTTSARVAPIPPRSNTDLHQHPLNDLESSAPLQPKEAPYDTGLGRKKQPFWRTTKGIVILGLVLLAIILAAVLGGVLGSRNKKNVNVTNGTGKGGDQGNSSGSVPSSGIPNGSAPSGAPGNGVGGALSSGINIPFPATPTAKSTGSATQAIGGSPTGSISSGNTGTTAPTGTGEADSQTGANTGSGTTGGGSGVESPGGSTGPTDF